MGGIRKDITGERFGRLVVLSFAETRRRCAFWNCLCDCGTVLLVRGTSLRCASEPTRSCGCLRIEKAAERFRRGVARRHGMHKSPEYTSWRGMFNRCYRIKCAQYHNYGGRGVKVCSSWRAFESFFADMGPRPSPQHSIDRIDVNGNYSCGHCEECVANGWPPNCQWQTQARQTRNRRSNTLLTCDGETLCVADWAERYGLNLSALYNRLRWGWPPDLAIKTPIGQKVPNLKAIRLPIDPLAKLKRDAVSAVGRAVRRGRLVQSPRCQHPGCTTVKVEGHHHNGYDREHWLDVVWLCRKHHEKAEIAAA